MNSNLAPEYWHTTTLGSVIELTYGKSLPAKSRDGVSCPVFGSNGEVGKHSIPLVKKPGLIVGRKGSFGEVHISEKPFFPIDTTYYIDKFHEQPIRYWFYQLRFLPLNQLNRATAIPGLNREDAYSQEIALPPLAEQKAIADKLDTLLAQVETTQARLERIPQILKRFRQSVLAAAVSGKLTEEWITTSSELKEIAEFQNGYAFKSSWFDSSGTHQVVRLGNIRDGQIELENSPAYISSELANEFKKYAPNPGDILISMTGTRFKKDYGFSCIIKDEKNLLVNQRVGRVIPNRSKISPEFLYLFLRSDIFRDQFFAGETGGVNQGNVGSKHILSILVKLPTINAQTEIVRRVDELFAHADRIEQQVNNALTRVNNLTQSILAKAFRGELTEQWRKDNPELISGENSAEALLKRIQAERAAAGKKKPRKVVRKAANGA